MGEPYNQYRQCGSCSHLFESDYIHDDCLNCVGCCTCAVDDAIPNDVDRGFTEKEIELIEKFMSESDKEGPQR